MTTRRIEQPAEAQSLPSGELRRIDSHQTQRHGDVLRQEGQPVVLERRIPQEIRVGAVRGHGQGESQTGPTEP